MGCDIHPVLEKKWDGRWVGLHAYPYCTIKEVWDKGEVVAKNVWHSPRPQHRNYRLFAALAGVRGDGPVARGLPNDASDLALMHLDDHSDLHSHSWVTAREWVAACLSIEGDPEKLFLAPNEEDPRVKNPYQHYLEIEIDEEGGESPDNYRIVFAFDN